jgi:alkyl hydroperoxide reductase subunit D
MELKGLIGFYMTHKSHKSNSVEKDMREIETLRERMPDAARDIKLNLQTVFQSTTLTPAQTWGAALASAIATRNGELARAVFVEAQGKVDENVIEDAMAAAALMAMNNVYYRFRHLVGKESYAAKPARLRMNWIGKPMSNKADFELFCLAVSAINGCEACIRSHEEVVTAGGVSEDQVHDAVRGQDRRHDPGRGRLVGDERTWRDNIRCSRLKGGRKNRRKGAGATLISPTHLSPSLRSIL